MHLEVEAHQHRSRRRGAELRTALLAAVWDELTERGYAALTFDAVARRAGTSRPVVNRRWVSKDAMARDAITWASGQFTLLDPDTGNLREDTVQLLEQLNDAFVEFAVAMTAQLAAFFEETGTAPAELRKSLVTTRWKVIEAVVQRAVERGEIDESRVTPRIVGLPYDLLRHDVLMNVRPMSSADMQEIVDTIYLPLISGKSSISSG